MDRAQPRGAGGKLRAAVQLNERIARAAGEGAPLEKTFEKLLREGGNDRLRQFLRNPTSGEPIPPGVFLIHPKNRRAWDCYRLWFHQFQIVAGFSAAATVRLPMELVEAYLSNERGNMNRKSRDYFRVAMRAVEEEVLLARKPEEKDDKGGAGI